MELILRLPEIPDLLLDRKKRPPGKNDVRTCGWKKIQIIFFRISFNSREKIFHTAIIHLCYGHYFSSKEKEWFMNKSGWKTVAEDYIEDRTQSKYPLYCRRIYRNEI